MVMSHRVGHPVSDDFVRFGRSDEVVVVVVDRFYIALFSALEQSQHRKLTLEKKILPPLLQGLEP